MAKQLNVNLSMTADTGQARRQLQELQRELDKLISSTASKSGQLPLTKEIQTALNETMQLKAALNAATNADTGKLNLTKFSENLKQGNISLTQYAKNLSNLGSDGEAAFGHFAKAIVSAETPIRQTGKLTNELWTTLKNTAKWQISSSVIHGLQGSISQAFSYAEKLDKSLTNIQIVTGQTSDQMARFAEEANKAAQSLSTTTTAYTDAALIFYQQGIKDDSEIEARTNATIKMAQVTGDNATQVSSYMTAIWNNFDNGSESLEHYADVITALGASTASSSAEIAQGLEKFASIGQTVGLSYDYATSALATIVATTRQSADTVGTSLKTIFSRLEGLNLGETLDDGTTLNKYSGALEKVGVSIKDASGNLKDMDQILDELGAKWQDLARDEKIALAQTVAGVRQYNQLMALMDNWDFMKENLNTAKNADGTLQKQADVYAESWEASQKRVEAAMQKIYKDLLDKNFFKEVNNLFTGLLGGVDNFINAIGGVPGVLTGIGTLVTTIFGKQIKAGINSAIYNFQIFTGKAKQTADETRQQALKATKIFYGSGGETNASSLQGEYLRNEINNRYELQKVTESLTPQQKEFYESLLNTAEAYNEVAINSQKVVDNLDKQRIKTQSSILDSVSEKAGKGQLQDEGGYVYNRIEAKQKAKDFLNNDVVNVAINKSENVTLKQIEIETQYAQEKEKLNEKIAQYKKTLEDSNSTEEEKIEITKELANSETQLSQIDTKYAGLLQSLSSLKQQDLSTEKGRQQAIDNATQLYEEQANKLGISNSQLRQYITLVIEGKEAEAKAIISKANATKMQEELNQKLREAAIANTTLAGALTGLLKGMSSLTMGLTSIKGAIDALNDTDLSFFDKFSRVTMGLSMGIPALVSGSKGLVSGLSGVSVVLSKTLIPGMKEGAKAATGLATGGIAGATSAGGLTAALGTLAATLGIVALAIGGVIVAYKLLKAAWEKWTPEGRLSVAKKEAEETKKALEESTKAVNEFKQAYDNWESLVNKTKDLTKGTEEYREAVQKANEAALELIKTYKLSISKGEYTVDSEGNYTITDVGYKQLKTTQYQDTINNNDAAINENTLKNENDAQKIINQFRYSNNMTKAGMSNYNNIVSLANQYNNGEISLEDLKQYASDHGREDTEEFAQAVTEFANSVEINKDINENLARDNELIKNKMSGDTSYNEEADSLYNKYLNRYYNSNGQISEEQAKEAGQEIHSGEYITKLYEDTLKSINSSDIDDNAKKNLALQLADAQLSGSKNIDLSGIDTSSWTEEFVKKTFGDNAELIQNAIDSIEIDASKIITTFTDLESTFKNLQEGSIIKQEDFDKLGEIGQTYFSQMLDGTYKLTGDAKEFYNIVKGEAVQQVKDNIQSLKNQNEQIDSLKYGNENYALNKNTQYSFQGDSQIYKSAWGTDDNGNALDQYSKAGADAFKTTVFNDQLKVLEALGIKTVEVAGEQKKLEDLWTDGVIKAEADAVATAMENQKDKLTDLDATQAKNAETIVQQTEALAMQSTSINEANGYLKDLEISEEEYSKVIKQAAKNEAEAHGLDYKTVAAQAKQLASAYGMTKDAALSAAIANQRMNKAIASLNKNVKTWTESLKTAKKTSTEYAEAVVALNDNLADLLNLSSGDAVPDGFLELPGVLENIEKASNGDVEAIRDLGFAMGELQITNIADTFLASLDADDAVAKRMSVLKDKLVAGIQSLQDAVNNGDINIGDILNDQLSTKTDEMGVNWVNALNEMAKTTQMSVEEMNNLLNELGVETDVTTIDVPQKVKVPEYTTTVNPTKWDDRGNIIESTSTTVQTGSKELDGVVPVAQINTGDAKGSAPGIHQMTYTGGGASGGVSPSATTGKGGGGKAKTKDKTDKDPNKYKKIDQEAERYHQINKELEQTSQELEDIDRKKSRAYGSNKVKQIQAESNALAKQAEQYNRLAKEAEEYYKNDAAKMTEYGAKIENGVITNYKALMQQQIDTYNAGYEAYVDAMNAAAEAFNASQDEVAYEAAKKQAEQVWQGVQDSYKEFTDNMGKFEDSVKQWKDAEQAAEEVRLKIYDNELEVIETIVSTWEDFYEMSETHMEFLAKLINDGVNHALDRMINYAEQAQLAFDKINIYTDGFDDVLDHIDSGLTMEDLLSGDFEIPSTMTDKDIDTLKEYANSIKEATEKMLDMRKAIVEELGTAFNDFNSNIEDAIGKIDVLKDYVSTYQNIIDIVGKKVLDPTGELTRKLINTTYLQARENTKMLRSQLDFQEKTIAEYNEKIANLEADNENGRHDYVIEELKKQLKEAEQEYEATQSEWLQSWEETVQGATDIYENAVHDIIDDLDVAIAGAAGTLSQLQEQFERGKIIEDEYVDDFKKIYELNKLNKDIIKSIDETDNIKGKQELKKLQEEINQLQEEGVEMSEYDLENLRRKYELELARQQLEEAQNAKSQVRMTRDTEGNWGYVYTADQDAVADAENNYADKLYAMQEANTQYIRDLQDSLVAFDEECTKTLEEIMLGEGTPEEKQERYNQALAFYQEHMDYLYAELEKATSNNKELYNNDWAAYNALTGYKISADEDFIDDFNETLYSQLTGLNTIEDAQNAFKDATNRTLGEVNQAWDDWYVNTQEGLALGGVDIDNYAQQVEDDVNNRIIPATEDLTDEVNEMAEEAARDFSDMTDYVQDFAFEYDQYIMDCIEITNEYIEALERLIQTFAEATEVRESFNSRDDEDSIIEGDWREVYDDNGNLVAWDVYDKKTGKAVNGNNVKISWSGNDIMNGYISNYNVKNGRLQTDGRAQVGSGGAGTTMTQEEIERLKKNGMATGGYTGDWNSSDGKIAMLHEKELVLNKEDTSNILSAVDLIRQISAGIDLNAMTMSNGFIESMIQPMQFDKTENIEQEVHITAEFPNATDKNEILEAFDNVINLAAQYAQRN